MTRTQGRACRAAFSACPLASSTARAVRPTRQPLSSADPRYSTPAARPPSAPALRPGLWCAGTRTDRARNHPARYIDPMRAALAQINTTVGDVWGNVEKMKGALERAVDAGANLVAFPELTVTGYPPEDLLMRPSFIQENLEGLAEFAGAVPEGVACAAGFVDLHGDLFNACAVVSGGEVLHRYHKRYLPNYGVFDENRYFREGSGSAVLKLDGTLAGVTVCEDMWYPGGPAREQALAGASVLLNVNGSPYHRQKILSRERMLRVRASDSGCYVVWCNLVGGQDELVFDGASVVIGPEGDVLARARQFEEDLLMVDLYPEEVLIQRLHESRPRKETPKRPTEIIDIPAYREEPMDRFGG